MLNRVRVYGELVKAIPQWHQGTCSAQEHALLLWSVLSKGEYTLALRSLVESRLGITWEGELTQLTSLIPSNHPYRVVAIDGSHCMPDHHEGSRAYLINIGVCAITYAEDASSVQFFSEPSIYCTDEGSHSESKIQAQRTCAELQAGIQDWDSTYTGDMIVTLYDGPLLPVADITRNADLFSMVVSVMNCWQERQSVVIGYVSMPQSEYLMQLLHLASYELLHEPCEWFLSDSQIGEIVIPHGNRLGLWRALRPTIPDGIRIAWTYVRYGAEIIRLEFPEYLLNDRGRLEYVLGIVVDQVQKGAGYPIALAEAHLQAVIAEPDRQFFYDCIAQILGYHGGAMHRSYKGARKRQIMI